MEEIDFGITRDEKEQTKSFSLFYDEMIKQVAMHCNVPVRMLLGQPKG